MANRKIKESFAKTKFSTTLKNICGDKVIATADTIADLDYKATLADGTVTEGAYQSEVNKLHADAIEELQKSKTSVNFNIKDIVLNENTSKYEFANPGDAIIARGVYDADGNETDVLDTTQFVANCIYIINKAFKVDSFKLPLGVILYFEVGGSFTGSSDNVTVECNYSNAIKTCSSNWILKNILFDYRLNKSTIYSDWFETTDEFNTYVETTIAPFTTAVTHTITLVIGTRDVISLDFKLPKSAVLCILGSTTNTDNASAVFQHASLVYDKIDNSELSFDNVLITFQNCNVITYASKNRTYLNCTVSCTNLEGPLIKTNVENSVLIINNSQNPVLQYCHIENSHIMEYNQSTENNLDLGSSTIVNSHIYLAGILKRVICNHCYFENTITLSYYAKIYNCIFRSYLPKIYPNVAATMMNCFNEDAMMINEQPKYATYNKDTDTWDYINANSYTTPPSLDNCVNVLGFRHLNCKTDRVSIRGNDHWIEMANMTDVENYRLAWKIIE